MANRTIELSLKANVGQLVAGLATARQAVNDTARDTATFVRNNEQDLQTAGRTMAGFGTALTAASGLAVKAAIDWESSWADVQKVNDGTHDQMTRLEEDLREMARTIPATHEEIAAVAEAAGRLGVGVDDVADFSRVMIDLGNTTDLSAEQAATAIARFSNIAGTSFSDADRLGSTIVDLGNNFATTETEIVEMSQRLAAAGSQAGLSEGEIMGLATAMSSVGIEAQAGGTAMTQTFNEIDAAVREGGDSLEGWAELAGTSASEFADAWRNDPAEAVDLVIQGLARVNESGGDVAGTLDDLGISGIRQADVMRRLASASEVAGDAMAMGNDAFAENSALSEEAAIRYDTAAMKIKTAWASIVDAAITAGSSLAPIVGDVAEMAGTVADAFGKLPDPVLGAVTALSGVAGTALLAGGGLLMVAPSAVQTWDAFKRLNKSTRGLPSAIRGVGKAGLYAAAGLAALSILRSVAENAVPAAKGVEEVTAALIDLENSGDAGDLDQIFQFGELKNEAGEAIPAVDGLGEALATIDIGGADDAMGRTGQHIGSFIATVVKVPNDIKRMNEQFEQMDEALAGMSTEDAAMHMRNLREEAEAAGRQDFSSWEELQRVLPEYAASIQEMANATGEAYSDAELLEMAMGNLPPAMQNAKDAADNAARQDELTGALEDVGVAADGTVDSLSDYLDML
ncbi:MAG: phage tail tape measure protein, partial [Yaniella sp.]|nr:phage tail tape measure protein [Yaniella sp.]